MGEEIVFLWVHRVLREPKICSSSCSSLDPQLEASSGLLLARDVCPYVCHVTGQSFLALNPICETPQTCPTSTGCEGGGVGAIGRSATAQCHRYQCTLS